MTTKRKTVEVELSALDADEVDSSILEAVVAALKGGPVGGILPSANPLPDPPPSKGARPAKLTADLQQHAEERITAALDAVTKRMEEEGKPPKFDPAAWTSKLLELWATLEGLKAAGYSVEAEAVEDET